MRARNSSEGPEPCNSDEIECEPPPLDLSSGHAWALFMKPGTQNSREDEFGECQEDTDDEDKVALVRNVLIFFLVVSMLSGFAVFWFSARGLRF